VSPLPEPWQTPAGWYARYEAPRSADGQRRQPRIGPYRTKRECKDALLDALGKVKDGKHVDDRRTRFGEHLDRRLRWWQSEGELKSIASYREAIELYLRPAYGHMRVIDLREHHGKDLAAAMRLINRPEADASTGDLLRRLLDARATRDGQRISKRPLTEARIRRVMAVASSACADLVPHTLPSNPFAKVKSGKSRKVRPLLWTEPRVARWQQTGEIPSRVMVWTRGQCGAFLDAIEGERLYALYHLAAYYGPRRNELDKLDWANVDLAGRRIHIRGDVKSEDSDRVVIVDAETAEVLRAWRKTQLAERLAWGSAWMDSGRVFTREDGAPLRPGWISTRFDTLAARAGLPPITLHGLRHGAATMLLAAGQPPKVISQVLGHSTVSFTMDVYTEVAEELADAAASAIAAYVPRKSKIVPGGAISVPSGAPDDH
jgi:integrase